MSETFVCGIYPRVDRIASAQVSKPASPNDSVYCWREQLGSKARQAIFVVITVRQRKNLPMIEPHGLLPDSRNIRRRTPNVLSPEYKFPFHYFDIYDQPGTFGIDDGLSAQLSNISLGFCQRSLALNRPQSSKGRKYTADAYENQDSGSNGCNPVPDEFPSINAAMVIFLCFGLGGLLLVFLPLYVCFLVSSSVHYERILFCASGVGASSASCAIIWPFLFGLYPFTCGLPPSWLPEKYCPRQKEDKSQTLEHGKTVSQKVLTSSDLLYYDNSMANALPFEKHAMITGSLCEGSSIRSIERLTGVHRDSIMRLGVRIGNGCAALLDRKMVDLSCQHLHHVTVLRSSPITSPLLAVRAFIIQEFKSNAPA
jgi:hypothetical protein